MGEVGGERSGEGGRGGSCSRERISGDCGVDEIGEGVKSGLRRSSGVASCGDGAASATSGDGGRGGSCDSPSSGDECPDAKGDRTGDASGLGDRSSPRPRGSASGVGGSEGSGDGGNCGSCDKSSSSDTGEGEVIGRGTEGDSGECSAINGPMSALSRIGEDVGELSRD